MKIKQLLALLLILLFLFCGCSRQDVVEPTSVPTTVSTEAAIDPVAVYETAVGEIESFSGVELKVNVQKQTFVDMQVFPETMDYTVTYATSADHGFIAKMAGDIQFGDSYTIPMEEIYYDGFVYGEMDVYGYQAEMAQDDFLARHVPADLFDPSAYDSVVLEDNIIFFQNASRLEDWLYCDGYELIEASGTATLDAQDQLTNFAYSASYYYGTIRHDVQYTVEIAEYTGIMQKPSVYNYYQEVPTVDIPYMIERAYGFLMDSDSKSMQFTWVVESEIAAYTVGTQGTTVVHRGDDFKIRDENTVEVLDWTTGEVYYGEYLDTYSDGVFSSFENGVSLNPNTVSAEEIQGYCDDAFIYYYPWLGNLNEIYCSYVPGGVVLDYSFATGISEGQRQTAQNYLFGEPQYLDLLASGYELLLSEGYLGIDIYSGLPTSCSTTYSATHTIDGDKYLLSMQLTYSYHAADRSAYATITGEQMPEENALEQPTPLFYHVTGENGQEMWMLGTIHVGDARTGNLPEEIYDAFTDADALAVEFDMNDFADQIAEDPALAETVLQEYLYLDGTTIENHLQIPDLYGAAVQTMKMTGQLKNTILYTKPVIWSQILEEFYLRQGYILSPDDGVDLQLLTLAEEQGKPIRNVESGMAQLEMFTGFSDEIQEILLASTLSVDPASYNAQQMELYELWCRGDAEAVKEVLKEDTSSMSQEELALYEEYTKAMDTDRNEEMLQVATEYLESGETIFFAVGLAHLLEDDGLVNTLQKAGYTVELVPYS